MRCAGRKDAACAVMNGANEAAVDLFLRDKIGFTDIFELVNEAVDRLGAMSAGTIDEVIAADGEARSLVYKGHLER
jgi:1-deoxy-D-xylulose-5-phosphate reductoisomerase